MNIPLTPLQFAERAFKYFEQRVAIVDGEDRVTYKEWAGRIFQGARALQAMGIRPGDRVAALMPNTGTMLDLFYAVPWIGAILVPLNTRLAADDYAYILEHSGARLLMVDVRLWPLVEPIRRGLPTVWTVGGWVEGCSRYESMREQHAGDPLPLPPLQEDDTVTINYTSGTTARPKGVELTHRNIVINAVDFAYHLQVGLGDVYLHTLPMFHVNGWGGVWAVTGVGGVHVPLPVMDGPKIWAAIRRHGVTHLCGAPAVLGMVVEAADGAPLPRSVRATTAGAPPPAAIIERMEAAGFKVLHVYGLTEVSPFITVSEWLPEEREWPARQRATRSSRQGIALLLSGDLRVVRPDGQDVAEDGEEMGEIICRGNVVMKGYYRDPEATAKAIREGWFYTGDLAVVHPDHYVEIRDRAKDVIISGGENISSVEVEAVLYGHPAVREVAVIGVPHDRWGETPMAVVALRDGAQVTGDALIRFCRDHLAHFKAPTAVSFVEALPRTASGKVQKFQLREPYWSGRDKRVN